MRIMMGSRLNELTEHGRFRSARSASTEHVQQTGVRSFRQLSRHFIGKTVGYVDLELGPVYGQYPG